jgi:hypothetical protein
VNGTTIFIIAVGAFVVLARVIGAVLRRRVMRNRGMRPDSDWLGNPSGFWGSGGGGHHGHHGHGGWGSGGGGGHHGGGGGHHGGGGGGDGGGGGGGGGHHG